MQHCWRGHRHSYYSSLRRDCENCGHEQVGCFFGHSVYLSQNFSFDSQLRAHSFVCVVFIRLLNILIPLLQKVA